MLTRALTLVALLVPALLAVAGALSATPAGAQSATGQITGRVTDADGVALAGISVLAAPVSQPDQATLATTDIGGRYLLEVAPGDYYVAFNTIAVNEDYDSATFGGPEPPPGSPCTVCGGQAVTVTAGGVTPGVNAALASPPYPQTGFIRPLSGNTLRVVARRVSFRFGCHIEPTGCIGTARLRLGRGTASPTIATTQVLAPPNSVRRLVFPVPAAVVARLRARRNGAAALVEITAPPSHLVTRFKLVAR